MPERMARVSWRLLFLGFLLSLSCLVLVGRLVQLQIVSHGYYAVEAEDEHMGTRQVLPPRGALLDSKGYPLALTMDSYDIYINGKVWQDSTAATEGAEALSTVVGKRPNEIRAAVAKEGESRLLLAAGLDYNVGKQVEAMGLAGVEISPTIKRYHPEGDLASSLIGFIGRDQEGLTGLEADLQAKLGGTPGTLYFERDSLGQPIPFGFRRLIDPQPASDVKLTIDRYIQETVEKGLDDTIEKYQAIGGTIIVMNPMTGAILAMASRPSFKLSELDLTDEAKMELYRNRAVTDLYEPGSVMKVVTMSTAVDLGLVTPNTTYEDTGAAYVAGAAIRNWDFSTNGMQTMTQLLQRSLNTGAVWVSNQIGPEHFYEYLRSFGFGEATNVGLSGEAMGMIRDSTDPDWYPVDLATNSFGQGVSVTPLQMITAVSTIVNGGNLMRPYIVKEVVRPDSVETTEPEVVRRVISEQASRTLVSMMNEVVEGVQNHGARIPGYHVGGKTGTSYVSIEGGYSMDRVIASFVGFAPVSDPQIIMLVKIDEPQVGQLGGTVAAPVFAELAPKILNYLGVAPDSLALVQQEH